MSHNQPVFNHFFALFEQPIDFDIDMAQLNNRLRALQQQFHPDQLTESLDNPPDNAANSRVDTDNGVNAVAVAAAQNSAVINHAYHVLSHADSRASYLLELAGQALDDNASISDVNFLDEAMDLRIHLEESSAADNLASIVLLKTTVAARLKDFSARFQTAYDAHDWAAAIDSTQKLKFLVKLDNDISKAIDNIDIDTHNDDDLYL